MNLAFAASVYAGGPGSGCRGQNCGRPATGRQKSSYGFIGNLDKGTVKWANSNLSSGSDSFWVTPSGDVYSESKLLGSGFHEHWQHAAALLKKNPEEFSWIKKASDDAMVSEKGGFSWKYAFVNNAVALGGIRAYVTVGSGTNWESGIEVGKLTDREATRVQSLMNGFPVDTFRVDWRTADGNYKAAEGTSKEVMRALRSSLL